jgi:hypothetical protein
VTKAAGLFCLLTFIQTRRDRRIGHQRTCAT